MSQRCFSTQPEREVYETDIKLDFGKEMKTQVYKCQPQTEGIARCRWYPFGSFTLMGCTILYKSLISYTHFIWPCLPIVPMFFFFKGMKITTEACSIITKEIKLQQNGQTVEIIDVIDQRKTHPIKTLRIPTDEEMKQLKVRYGSFVADEDDFYPVLVTSTRDPKLIIQAFFLDKNANIKDKSLLHAICNGSNISFQK